MVEENETSHCVHRVLVVDDHPDTTEVLSVMFQVIGYDTRGEVRGRDALRAAREFEPDLILLDIGLPDLSGYEIVHAMRDDPRVRDRFIVAVTGWGRTQDIVRAKQAGFDAHFVKPIDLAKIRQILRLAGSDLRSRAQSARRAQTLEHPRLAVPGAHG
jgi:CheY-like chemotaxis protein